MDHEVPNFKTPISYSCICKNPLLTNEGQVPKVGHPVDHLGQALHTFAEIWSLRASCQSRRCLDRNGGPSSSYGGQNVFGPATFRWKKSQSSHFISSQSCQSHHLIPFHPNFIPIIPFSAGTQAWPTGHFGCSAHSTCFSLVLGWMTRTPAKETPAKGCLMYCKYSWNHVDNMKFWKTDSWKINKNSPNGLVDVSRFSWEPQGQRFPSTNFGQRLRSLLALGLALREGAEKWTMPSCWMETCGWQHGPQWLGPCGCHPQSGNDVIGMPVEPFKTLKPYFVQRIPMGFQFFHGDHGNAVGIPMISWPLLRRTGQHPFSGGNRHPSVQCHFPRFSRWSGLRNSAFEKGLASCP